MKKIILFIGLIFTLTGCTTKTMTCTSDNTANGLTSKTTYVIKYKNDDVKDVRITYEYNQNTNIDGVGTGTDGTTDDTNRDNDGVVDGVIGDAIDGIADTIVDIAGIRTAHENRLATYNNYNGFSSDIDTDSDNNYKIIYKIDLTKMNDTDLTNFNIDRSYTTLRSNYLSQGLTCK